MPPIFPRPSSARGKPAAKPVAGSGHPPSLPRPQPYAPRVDLTLTEAWTLWWSGQQLTEHSIHGMSVLWAARTGKLLAFLAGTTIVLDIVGSERIIRWGESIVEASLIRRTLLACLPVTVLSYPLSMALGAGDAIQAAWPTIGGWLMAVAFHAVAGAAGGALLVNYGHRIAINFGRLLARPRFERWLRIIAVPLFFIGFALDYLAS